MNRLKSLVLSGYDRLCTVPPWIFGVVILLTIAGVAYSEHARPSPPDDAAPADLVAAVRADIAAITKSTAQTDSSVASLVSEEKTHTQLLTEIRDLLKSPGRRVRSAETASATDQITLPDGTQHELLALVSRSTGRFTVEGGRYRAALLGSGFQDGELPTDEGQCRLIYDAWKSGQAPQLQSASRYQAPRYQCNGKSCRLVR